MRKIILAAAALGALAMLPACADGYRYGHGYGYYGASVGSSSVYYDGFYGPYSDGYWGSDAFFYYRGADGRFMRDDGRHFRREQFQGARSYQARPRDDQNRARDPDRDGR